MRKRYKLTEDKIARKLKEGRGTGNGGSYKPWLTVRDVPSRGEANRIAGLRDRRLRHFLSRLELSVFLDLEWRLDVIDVREQFPLDRASTREIAQALGVRHPKDGDVEIVMTSDFLVDFGGATAGRQVAVEVKLAADLENARTIEKLELSRRYWAIRGVSQRIVTEHEVSERRRRNLVWLREWRWLDAVAVPFKGFWEDRCAALLADLVEAGTAAGRPLPRFLADVEARRGWGTGEAMSALRHLGATRLIEIDPGTFKCGGPVGQVRVAATQCVT